VTTATFNEQDQHEEKQHEVNNHESDDMTANNSNCSSNAARSGAPGTNTTQTTNDTTSLNLCNFKNNNNVSEDEVRGAMTKAAFDEQEKTKTNTATGKACEGADEYSHRTSGVSYKATKRSENNLQQQNKMITGEVVLLQIRPEARPTEDERETVHQIGETPRATPSPPFVNGTGVRAVGQQATQQQAENSARSSGTRRQREEVQDEATTGVVEAASEEGEQQQDRSDPDVARGSTASSEAATRPVPTGIEDSAVSSGNSASMKDMSATDAGTNSVRGVPREVL
jgi:hypothetical protein